MLYFASYIVVDVKKEKRDKDLPRLEDELNAEIEELEEELAERHRAILAESFPLVFEHLEAFMRETGLPLSLEKPRNRLKAMARTAEEWKAELEEGDRPSSSPHGTGRIENIGKESKKKAGEKAKSKSERVEDVRAGCEKSIAATRAEYSGDGQAFHRVR